VDSGTKKASIRVCFLTNCRFGISKYSKNIGPNK
jgi:hypothetical protein